MEKSEGQTDSGGGNVPPGVRKYGTARDPRLPWFRRVAAVRPPGRHRGVVRRRAPRTPRVDRPPHGRSPRCRRRKRRADLRPASPHHAGTRRGIAAAYDARRKGGAAPRAGGGQRDRDPVRPHVQRPLRRGVRPALSDAERWGPRRSSQDTITVSATTASTATVWRRWGCG